jgi:paraquat-inducible protein B
MSMIKFIPLFLLFLLSGCGQDLHFKISYNDIAGLAEGDPVVKDGQPVGKVTAFEKGPTGENLVEVTIPRESATAATSEASFVLSPDPDKPGHKRIELVLAGPGGKAIADGSVVKGSYPSPFALQPLTDFLKSLTDGLRDFRSQVELFRREFEKLPNSPEAKGLEQEWRKLMDEINQAQNGANESLQKEILPKLQKEMDELRKRMEEMQKAAAKKEKHLGV